MTKKDAIKVSPHLSFAHDKKGRNKLRPYIFTSYTLRVKSDLLLWRHHSRVIFRNGVFLLFFAKHGYVDISFWIEAEILQQ